MFNDVTLDFARIPGFNYDDHNKKFFESTDELKQFYMELSEEIHADVQMGENFAQLAWKYISGKKINKAQFQTLTLLSEKMYTRIRDNKLPKPHLETAMAIAIGLKLGPHLGEGLIEKAGYKLNDSPLHRTYKKLLTVFKGQSIYECNKVLEALNFKPLCGKEYLDVISQGQKRQE